jgi:hypothetical protein
MAMSVEVVRERKRRDERGGEIDQETLLHHCVTDIVLRHPTSAK